QDAHAHGQIGELGRQRDRLPEAAQVFPARRAGTDVRQLRVLPGDLAREVSGVGRVEEGHAHAPGPCAVLAWMAAHTRAGVRGRLVMRTPRGASASSTALAMAAGDGIAPPSPTPLAP